MCSFQVTSVKKKIKAASLLGEQGKIIVKWVKLDSEPDAFICILSLLLTSCVALG